MQGKVHFEQKGNRAFTFTLAPNMRPIDITANHKSQVKEKTNICPHLQKELIDEEPPEYHALRCPIYQKMQKKDPFATQSLDKLKTSEDLEKKIFTEKEKKTSTRL